MRLSVICSAIFLSCIFYLKQCDAHATMIKPINWFDHKTWIQTKEGLKFDYSGMKSGLQCYAGCDMPDKDVCPSLPNGCDYPAAGCSCLWYQNNTRIETPTLFEQKYRTFYYIEFDPRALLTTPWRAPGMAKVDSPCGVSGGNLHGCVGGCSHENGGYAGGVKAEQVKFKHQLHVTNWTRGAVVEAAFSISANHGGGYSYRLCKVPKSGIKDLTEELCQKIPLEFFGDTQWAQYGEDVSTRVSFPAVRLDKGTYPKGSQWTKNPIPACRGLAGGYYDLSLDCPGGYQFEPSKEGLFGYGLYNYFPDFKFQFSVIDKLKIPEDIEPGDYVLSFRWDCEQTPQVWNSCASINLS